jgi:hypothetical protein
MTSISTPFYEKCPRCGSRLVSLEWDERVNTQEVSRSLALLELLERIYHHGIFRRKRAVSNRDHRASRLT